MSALRDMPSLDEFCLAVRAVVVLPGQQVVVHVEELLTVRTDVVVSQFLL